MKKLWTLFFCLWAFLINAQSVSISSSAPSNIICSGNSVTFTANAMGFTNPTYQWTKNGNVIPGANSATYSSATLSNNDQINVWVNAGINPSSIVSNGLKLNLDASNPISYSGTGNTWYDLSGNNNHAALTNSPTYDGVTKSLVTNGTNQYLSIPIFNTSITNVTMQAWVYINTNSKGVFISNGYGNGYSIGIGNGGFDSNGSKASMLYSYRRWINTDVSYTSGWHLVTMVLDGSSTPFMYIDNALKGSTTGYSGTEPIAPTGSFTLGATPGDGGRYYAGNFAAAYFYDRVLSLAEITQNYNAFSTKTTGYNSNTITVTIAGSVPTLSVNGDACVNKSTLSTPAGQTSYAWYKDNTAISGANLNTYSPTTAGDYKVAVTSGTCSSTSATTTISTCGVTADGRMMSLAFPAPLVSTDGGANVGTGIDEQGKIHNTTGITTTKGTIGATTAIIGGVIGSTNGRSTSIGVVYSTDSNFSTSSTVTIQSNVAAGTYSTTLTGLTSVTTYFAKSFVVNKAGTSYGPVVSFTTSAPPAAVGDLFGGGIIYYILQPSDDGYDANVQHGLIAQPQNEEAYGAITWTRVALNNNTISGAQYDGISKGSSNSAAIITNQGSGTYLFKYVSTLTINGYTDWYVPSIRELSLFRAFIFNPTYCTSGSGRYYWVSKANSNYKWTWGNYISSTQTGSLYKTNYVEGNSEGTTTYAKTQSGDNFVYVAIRSF